LRDTLSIVNRASLLGVKVTAVFEKAVKVKVLNPSASLFSKIIVLEVNHQADTWN